MSSILWSGPGHEYLSSNLNCLPNRPDQIATTDEDPKFESDSCDQDDRRLSQAVCQRVAPGADARSRPEQWASRVESQLILLESLTETLPFDPSSTSVEKQVPAAAAWCSSWCWMRTVVRRLYRSSSHLSFQVLNQVSNQILNQGSCSGRHWPRSMCRQWRRSAFRSFRVLVGSLRFGIAGLGGPRKRPEAQKSRATQSASRQTTCGQL